MSSFQHPKQIFQVMDKKVITFTIKLCLRQLMSKAYQNGLIVGCLFVCFVCLRPKSTAMVIAGRSVHLTTLSPGQA